MDVFAKSSLLVLILINFIPYSFSNPLEWTRFRGPVGNVVAEYSDAPFSSRTAWNLASFSLKGKSWLSYNSRDHSLPQINDQTTDTLSVSLQIGQANEGSQRLHSDNGEGKPIFNGKNFYGWVVPLKNKAFQWYTVKNKILQIRSGPKERGSILWTKKAYRDFIFEFEFRFVSGRVDSGIHLRNRDQIQLGISGSLGRDMTGSPYIPGKGYPVEAENVDRLLELEKWNQTKIRAIGPNYTVWLQNEKIMNYTSDTSINEGPIGVQLHENREMAIDFRNLTVLEL